MNHQAILELLETKPFRPFTVTMTSGKTRSVNHPELAVLTPRSLVVVDPETDRVSILPLIHMAGVDTTQAA